jgi:hypothetical protein
VVLLNLRLIESSHECTGCGRKGVIPNGKKTIHNGNAIANTKNVRTHLNPVSPRNGNVMADNANAIANNGIVITHNVNAMPHNGIVAPHNRNAMPHNGIVTTRNGIVAADIVNAIARPKPRGLSY